MLKTSLSSLRQSSCLDSLGKLVRVTFRPSLTQRVYTKRVDAAFSSLSSIESPGRILFPSKLPHTFPSIYMLLYKGAIWVWVEGLLKHEAGHDRQRQCSIQTKHLL